MKLEKQTIRSTCFRPAVHLLIFTLFIFVSYMDASGQEHDIEALKKSTRNESLGVLKDIASHHFQSPEKTSGTRFEWRDAYRGEWYFEARYPVVHEDDQVPYGVHIMFTGVSKAHNNLDVSIGLHTKLWTGLGVWHLQDFKPKTFEEYKSEVELHLSNQELDGMYLDFQAVRNGKFHAVDRGETSENIILHWYIPNRGELIYWTSEFTDEKTGTTYPIIVRIFGRGTKAKSLIKAYIKKYPSTMEVWWVCLYVAEYLIRQP